MPVSAIPAAGLMSEGKERNLHAHGGELKRNENGQKTEKKGIVQFVEPGEGRA